MTDDDTTASGTDSATLAGRIIWALQRADMTQAELARRLEIGKSAVSQWTTGETRQITPQHLFPAARLLRVEPEWLGTGLGPRTAAEARAVALLPPELAAALPAVEAVLRAPPAVREAVVALLRACEHG